MRGAPSHPRRLGLLLTALLLLGGSGGAAQAEQDVRERALALTERAKDDLDAGREARDPVRVAAARDGLRRAQDLLTAALRDPYVDPGQAAVLRRDLVDVEVWLRWAEDASRDLAAAPRPGGVGPGAAPGSAPGAGAAVPARKDGAQAGPWVKEQGARYAAATDPAVRAAIATGMAAEAGIHALPALFKLFQTEADPVAREGVHEALARVGTSRVSQEMEKAARRDQPERWEPALDVICRALARPDAVEPERPWCRAVRAFHELKERALSLALITRLDAMGTEGVAALGEVLYVEDFGYHDHTTALLGRKRDRRAVPPLVFKLNRFAFEAQEQMPAHKALLQMGWYAVPELIDRLDDKAAGIWISWTLRKITGETMGTDKRKWHDWWKGASLRHPELFDDPAERPPGASTPSDRPAPATTPSR